MMASRCRMSILLRHCWSYASGSAPFPRKHKSFMAWEYGSQVYRDELIRVFIDVPDAPEHQQFFQEN